MLRRTLSTLVVAIATLTAVGCAGTSEQPRAEVPDSASLAPADALVYATATTDESSDQWKAAEELIDRIPGAREGLAGAVTSGLDDEGLSWTDSSGRTFIKGVAELADWLGERAQAGRQAPQGFPRNNRFG